MFEAVPKEREKLTWDKTRVRGAAAGEGSHKDSLVKFRRTMGVKESSEERKTVFGANQTCHLKEDVQLEKSK